METYIKLYRKILDNPDLVKDNNAFIMFTKLLLKVDRKTGTYTAGRMQLATLCNMKPVTAYRTTLRLVEAGLVTALPNTKYTTYTVVNWDKYQSKKEKGEQLGNNLSHEPVPKVNTKQEKEKEKKKVNKVERDVLGILNRVTGRSFRAEPIGIEKTKAMFTDEEIERALKNMYKEDWHKPMMSKLKPDYLLRATTIDQFKDFERPDSKYVLPGSVMKPTAVKEPGLTRKQMLEKEYQNG